MQNINQNCDVEIHFINEQTYTTSMTKDDENDKFFIYLNEPKRDFVINDIIKIEFKFKNKSI